MGRVSQRYRENVISGAISADPAQQALLPKLDALLEALERPVRRGFFGRTKTSAVKGLYIWGGVGGGKSYLMDLFANSLAVAVRRVHFHAFMQEVQAALHLARQTNAKDALLPVCQVIAKDIRVLALDEMQIKDIADAMILARLFTALFDRGVTVVATSNRHADELYKNGLHRDRFLPFIELLKTRCDIREIAAGQDWRASMLAALPAWYVPDDPQADAALSGTFRQLAGTAQVTSDIILVAGREIHFDQVAGDVARASFAALCETPLAARDYLAIAGRFAGLIIDHVPALSDANEAAARRFMWLVDALYDRQRFLIASAASEIETLYDGHLFAFEFDRTRSRLGEMTRRHGTA